MEICDGFHARLSVGIIAHHMGKHVGIGIDSGLTSVGRHIRPGNHFPVRAVDASPHHAVCKGILPRIIRTVDDIRTLKHVKIHQIQKQADEYSRKQVGDDKIFLIVLTVLPGPSAGLPSVRKLLLLFFAFQIQNFQLFRKTFSFFLKLRLLAAVLFQALHLPHLPA